MLINICIIAAALIMLGLGGLAFMVEDQMKDRKELKRIKDTWLY